MSNESRLADTIIQRLNALLTNDKTRQDIRALIETRVPCSDDTADHPDIVVQKSPDGTYQFGFLGLLNGLVGAISEGPRKGWGRIAALYDDDDQLIKFERTDPKLEGPAEEKKRLYKIRPADGGSWLITEDLNYLQEFSGTNESDEGETYEVVVTFMTQAEIDALPEHDGW
jgi:hypothetical protein